MIRCLCRLNLYELLTLFDSLYPINSAESLGPPDQNGGNFAPGHFCPILRVALGAILVLQILPSVAPCALFRWNFRLLELLPLRSLGRVRKAHTHKYLLHSLSICSRTLYLFTCQERRALFSHAHLNVQPVPPFSCNI